MRASIARSRAPSSRAASSCANGSWTRSASAGPRHCASASRGLPAPRELLEALDVELAGLDAHEVSGRAGHDPVGAERRTERMDVHLERVQRPGRRRLAPDPVDQPVGGDGLVRLEEQLGEQGTGPRAPQRNRDAVVVEHLQRPQQTEFHSLTTPPYAPLSRA